MPQSPPCKRFQVHLSTAIILMFVAGAFIWANMVPFRGMGAYHFQRKELDIPYIYIQYGWPISVSKIIHLKDLKDPRSSSEADLLFWERLKSDGGILYAGIAVNLLIALLLLVITWFLCERWIAYRASRKGP